MDDCIVLLQKAKMILIRFMRRFDNILALGLMWIGSDSHYGEIPPLLRLYSF